MTGQWFTVTVHSVWTDLVDTAKHDKAIAELLTLSPQLKNKVKLLNLTSETETLKIGKPYGSLTTSAETQEKANIMVGKGPANY